MPEKTPGEPLADVCRRQAVLTMELGEWLQGENAKTVPADVWGLLFNVYQEESEALRECGYIPQHRARTLCQGVSERTGIDPDTVKKVLAATFLD